jgi:hypothetical protein
VPNWASNESNRAKFLLLNINELADIATPIDLVLNDPSQLVI